MSLPEKAPVVALKQSKTAGRKACRFAVSFPRAGRKHAGSGKA
jgi:hypothetical protein